MITQFIENGGTESVSSVYLLFHLESMIIKNCLIGILLKMEGKWSIMFEKFLIP